MVQANIIEKAKEKLFEYERRHLEILDAAIRIFNAKGYTVATTAEIAKAAGVNEPVMYKHYGNKAGLFLACFQAISDELLQAYRRVYKDCAGDEIGYLEGVARVYIDFVQSNPHKSMFLVHLLSYRDQPDFDTVFMDFMESSIEVIRVVIASAQAKGRIKSPINARLLANIFVNQYFNVAALRQMQVPIDEMRPALIEMVHNMLRIEE